MTASASVLDLNEGYMYICILNVERTLPALRSMETITYFNTDATKSSEPVFVRS